MPSRALFLIFLLASAHAHLHHDGASECVEFSNEWVVHLKDSGDPDEAQLIALKLGYEYVGQIPRFPGHFLLRKSDHPLMNRDASSDHTQNLLEEARVLWAQQQFTKRRVKRVPYYDPAMQYSSVARVMREEQEDRENLLDQMVKRELDLQMYLRGEDDSERGIPQELLDLWDEARAETQDRQDSIPEPREKAMFNDQLWDHQWYMQDTRSASSRSASASPSLREINLHVTDAFRLGVTGSGIRVCVIDDGLEREHPDLKNNYDPSISWDYNSGVDGDPDPTPRYPVADPADPDAPLVPNSHGTRCAGEIAMAADNGICGVGVAYNAKIGGIRMLDGKINDRIEGLSLTHAIDKVDIFTASWGPVDDGKTVEAPGKMAAKALEEGVRKGRGGKGVIYVWAAGNGGAHQDNCNCDGYTSSRYTVSIGSASEQGEFPWYGERCSSTMASTFSSGAYTDQKIATTDTNGTCTVSHTGTSAAAPLAAGIVALGLEANNDLTWRDVQHLVAATADPKPLAGNKGWKTNGAGLEYSNKFGFGILNAYKFVEGASKWENVGKEIELTAKGSATTRALKRSQGPFTAEFSVDSKKVSFLEHVELKASVSYPVRGALEIVLVSPAGTISQLLTVRPEDKSESGFKEWRFNSVHFWGENPQGTWTLYVVDKTSEDPSFSGEVSEMELKLFGLKQPPTMFHELRKWMSRDDFEYA